MATRVNFNVFRYGKTVKWNFSAPSTSFNKLIRASYVFNKWCPLILESFFITALKFIFKIESVNAEIIFAGYRRISYQTSMSGYISGSAFHSRFNEYKEQIRMPLVPRITNLPFHYEPTVFMSIPKKRLLEPFGHDYTLAKKALGYDRYDDRPYSPIITKGAQDTRAQLAFYKNYEISRRLYSPFVRRIHKPAVLKRKWKLTKKLKIKLKKLFQQGEFFSDPVYNSLVEIILSKKRSYISTKVPLFQRAPASSEMYIYFLSSFNRLYLDLRRIKNKLKVAVLNFFHFKKMLKVALRSFISLGRSKFYGQIRLHAFNLARLSLIFKRRRIKFVKKYIKLMKLYKKKRRILFRNVKFLKANNFSLNNFLAVGMIMSKAPSAIFSSSLFSHDKFFTRIKKGYARYRKKIAKHFSMDFFNNLRAKRIFRSTLKLFIKNSWSRIYKDVELPNLSSKKKKFFSLPALKLNLSSLMARREAALLFKKSALKLSIHRYKLHPFYYTYSASSRALGVKRFVEFLVALLDELNSLNIFGNRREVNIFSQKLVKLAQSLFVKLSKIQHYVNFSNNYLSLFLSLGKNVFTILRSDAHLYNILINFSTLVNKFKNGRRLAIGEVLGNTFSLRSFPLTEKFLPLPSVESKEFTQNFSFKQQKLFVSQFSLSFSYEQNLARNVALHKALIGDFFDYFRRRKLASWSRVETLFANCFTPLKDMRPEVIPLIKSRYLKRAAIKPYCDDIKEALSLDFVDSYDSKKLEKDDDEYKTSILFSNPLSFFTDSRGGVNDEIVLNLKQLKFSTSTIIGKLGSLARNITKNKYFYRGPDGRKVLIPSHFLRVTARFIELTLKIHNVVKILYREHVVPSEINVKKQILEWYFFSRLVFYIISYFTNFSILKNLAIVPSTASSTSTFFPIIEKNLVSYNKFLSSPVSRFSNRFVVSSQFFISNYYKFFNYYFVQGPSATINAALLPFFSKKIGNIVLESYSTAFQRSNRQLVYFTEPPRNEGDPTWLHRTAFSLNNPKVNSKKAARVKNYFNNISLVNYCNLSRRKKYGVSSSRVGFMEGLWFSSQKNVLNFLGDREISGNYSFINFSVYLNYWILQYAAKKIIFADYSIDLNDSFVWIHDIFRFKNQTIIKLFRNFFYSSTFRAKKFGFYYNSFFTLLTHMVYNNKLHAYVDIAFKTFYSKTARRALARSRSGVPWLSKNSSPFSKNYLIMHGQILNDLTRAFYAIFSIPFFVKYFSMPAFFAATPELSKFASETLAEVNSQALKMDSHTKDWFLEYLFICYASLFTKNAEGIVDFMVKILPYYRKWADPITLLLSPIAGADFKALGISTIKVSFRGRPSGVERARAYNYIYGHNKDPAMRRLFVAGSYYYRQCIATKNGGVTTIHMWILSEV